MEPLVSAIVLNYHTPKDTIRCLQALRQQTMKDRMEFFAVDNHSLDESIGMLRAFASRFTEIRVVESRENGGFGSGNSLAAHFAQGKYLLFMNPDNTPPPDAIEKLAAIVEQDDNIGIAGPALIHPDGSVRPSARRFPKIRDLLLKRLSSRTWHKRHTTAMKKKEGAVREVDWIVGACLLIRRDLFEELQGFDPRFFLFFEDTDLCRRCKAKGKKVVYAPQIRVADQKQRLSDGTIFAFLTKKTARIHLASAIKYFRKWKRVS